MFSFAEKARTEFEAGNLEKRKQILAIIGSNHIIKDKKLFIKAEKPLILIQKATSEINGINQMLEPLKSVGDKGLLKQMYAKSPILCTLVEQVRTSLAEKSPQFNAGRINYELTTISLI